VGGQAPTHALNASYSAAVDVICSEAIRPVVGLRVGSFAALALMTEPSIPAGLDPRLSENFTAWLYPLAQVRATVSKVPGFFFSSYQPVARRQSVLLREDQYVELARQAHDYWRREMASWAPDPDSDLARIVAYSQRNFTLTRAPKQRLLVRMRPDAGAADRLRVSNGLRAFFAGGKNRAIDTQALVETIANALGLLNTFFVVVGAVSMLLCFLILWLSFSANVAEHAWEFGVFRALGVTKWQAVMLYVYEALALVLAGCALGCVIGVAIAVSLTLQMNLFTEMPFRFAFPSQLAAAMLGMSLFVAVVGSFAAARKLLHAPIARVLRDM
jgi:hypothetical protein